MSTLANFTWKRGKQPQRPANEKWANVHKLNADAGIIAKPGQASGQAAIGAVLKKPDGVLKDVISRRIGWVQDHHIAEYRALIEGLRLARGHRIARLQVQLDSRLVVEQLGGTSKVRKPHLDSLHKEATAAIAEFALIKISNVPRKQNSEADALASRALGR